MNNQVAVEQAMDALKRVNMQDKAELGYKDLSQVELQKIAIARALAMNPDVILVDECTADLDEQGTNEILNLIKSLKEYGKTIIYATREMNLANKIADDVLVLN